MLLKHVELGKEDAAVIHQSVLEVDETASKDLRSNASRRTCTGSEPKVLEANRRSATQAMNCETSAERTCSGSEPSARSQSQISTGNDCETQSAERRSRRWSAQQQCQDRLRRTPLPLTKHQRQSALHKRMRFIPKRKPVGSSAGVADMATDIKDSHSGVIHQPMNSAHR